MIADLGYDCAVVLRREFGEIELLRDRTGYFLSFVTSQRGRVCISLDQRYITDRLLAGMALPIEGDNKNGK